MYTRLRKIPIGWRLALQPPTSKALDYIEIRNISWGPLSICAYADIAIEDTLSRVLLNTPWSTSQRSSTMSLYEQTRKEVEAILNERPLDILPHDWAHMTLIKRFPRRTFRYLTLNPKAHDLRLISLLSGGRFDEIKCRLMEVSIKDNPCYEALSYTWGGGPKVSRWSR